jgi:hypothetical protein
LGVTYAGRALHTPGPDQQAPLTQAPLHSASEWQLFRTQPWLEQLKFVGQLVGVHALATQWPELASHVDSPGGVLGQS